MPIKYLFMLFILHSSTIFSSVRAFKRFFSRGEQRYDILNLHSFMLKNTVSNKSQIVYAKKLPIDVQRLLA